MTTYYCDPAAAGANSGASWTDAWQTFQRAIDGTGGTKPVAGDIVLCRGTETVSVMIDSDGNAGSSAAGPVTFRGVNSSGTDDGTLFCLDAANNTLTGIVNLVADYIAFENFELKRCTGHGFRCAGYSSCDHNSFVNCYSHNNTASGWINGNAGLRWANFIRCRSETNGAYGYDGIQYGSLVHCIAKGNTSGGFRDISGFSGSHVALIDSAFTGNGGNGITIAATAGSLIYECVADGNTTDGIQTDQPSVLVYGCRLTENTNGIDVNAMTHVAHCYMPGSGQARDNSTANIDIAGSKYYDVLLAGASTNNLAGTDANGGYTSPTTDFTLASGATLRNQAVPLDATMNVYVAAGLSPSAAAVAASGGYIIGC